MSRYNTRTARAPSRSPVTTGPTPTGRTYEGAPGYAYDPHAELYLLAVSSMVGQAAFYEPEDDRHSRFVELVHLVAVQDWPWLTRFLPWLRRDAHMRTAPVVGALEAVRARLAAGLDSPTSPAMVAATILPSRTPRDRRPDPRPVLTHRQLVDAVLQRADEPGEALAYWISRYGRAVPMAVKRGIGDAARRLYTPQALLKYDTPSHGVRFADVLEITHPDADPTKPWQGDLFTHAIDRRHDHDHHIPDSLPTLIRNRMLRATTDPEAWLDPDMLAAAGMTWEDALSAVGSRVDKARLWTALIPSMGYMALLRNLANFDRAGVGKATAARVAARLADPEQVAASRQLPMRFLSAHRAVPSLRWGPALEEALNHSLAGIPALPGRTLVLIDTSSSMHDPLSRDSELRRWDAAAVFGLALAARCESADVVSFSHHTQVFPLRAGESLLRAVDRWQAGGYFLGGGTDTAAAVRAHYAGHNRVVILTDEQAADGDPGGGVPADRFVHTFNLAGYTHGHAPSGTGTRHTYGGLTDAAFTAIGLVERGRSADWPF